MATNSDLISLLHNEEDNELRKIAKLTPQGTLIVEYKAFPHTKIGDNCLKRTYFTDSAEASYGEYVSVSTWTQALENIANPPAETPSAPTDIILTSTEIASGSGFGDIVGTLTTTDSNNNEAHTYTIVTDSDDKFQIVGSELQLKNNVDYDTDSSHNVTIRTTDLDNLYYDKAFVITIIPEFQNVNSLSLDGVNEYIDFTNNSDILNRTTNFTYSCWIKTTSGTQGLLCRQDSGDNIFRINTTVDDIRVLLYGISGYKDLTAITNFSDNIWFMLTVTFDGTDIKVYYNNTLPSQGYANNDTFTNIKTGTTPLVFGFYNAGNYFTGNVDEITIWDKALSLVEVTELYNFGTPMYPKSHSSASDLAHWWQCGEQITAFPTMPDQQGAINATLVNMEPGDIDTDVS